MREMYKVLLRSNDVLKPMFSIQERGCAVLFVTHEVTAIINGLVFPLQVRTRLAISNDFKGNLGNDSLRKYEDFKLKKPP